jgi:hypothetical protein
MMQLRHSMSASLLSQAAVMPADRWLYMYCLLYCPLLAGAAHCWAEGVTRSSSQEGPEAASSKQEGFWQQLIN